MSDKIRIYDLARKLNKSNKELLAVLQQLDVPVKSHSSSIDEETAQIVENIIKEASEAKSQEKKQKGAETSKQKPDKFSRPQTKKGLSEKQERQEKDEEPERDFKPEKSSKSSKFQKPQKPQKYSAPEQKKTEKISAPEPPEKLQTEKKPEPPKSV